jgi:hypothetical protein
MKKSKGINVSLSLEILERLEALKKKLEGQINLPLSMSALVGAMVEAGLNITEVPK